MCGGFFFCSPSAKEGGQLTERYMLSKQITLFIRKGGGTADRFSGICLASGFAPSSFNKKGKRVAYLASYD